MESTVFWDVTLCSSQRARRFGGTHHLHLQGKKSKMKVIYTFETPGCIQTIRRYIPEDRTVLSYDLPSILKCRNTIELKTIPQNLSQMNLKTEAGGLSEKMVTIYQTTRRHIPEDSIFFAVAAATTPSSTPIFFEECFHGLKCIDSILHELHSSKLLLHPCAAFKFGLRKRQWM
jgi:hypothetical protein